MAAPIGNRFWEARSTHGRGKIFSSADELWEACCEYFKWVEDNPLWENKVTQYQGAPVDMIAPKMRAMTIMGLCRFLGINRDTWQAWRTVEDFSGTTAMVDDVIREQKLTGAAADLLNANIIARDLGLADKTEVKQTASIKVAADMSPTDAARAYQDLMSDDG